jgi:hypothetical protein
MLDYIWSGLEITATVQGRSARKSLVPHATPRAMAVTHAEEDDGCELREALVIQNGDVGDWRLADAEFLASFQLPIRRCTGRPVDARPFPREHRIQFDETSHVYTVDGVRVPRSVTGLIHLYCNEFDPHRALATMKATPTWRGKCMSIAEEGLGTADEDFIERWQFNGKVQRARGYLLHFQAEAMVNGRCIALPWSPEFQQAKCIYEFVTREWGFRPLRTEVSIFHCGLRLAGQPDLLCKDRQGRIVIIDWKRVRRIKAESMQGPMRYPLNMLPDSNYWHYALQLNLYAYILESEYSLAVAPLMYLAVVHPEAAAPRLVAIPKLEDEMRALAQYEIENGRGTMPLKLDAIFQA